MSVKAAPEVKTSQPAAAAKSARSFTAAPKALLMRKCACGSPGGGECEECAAKQLPLQRRAASHDQVSSIPPIVNDVLAAPGRPLDEPARGLMESRFGHDFGQVRIHDDAQAAASARAVHAHAYTVGQDIVFAPGRYEPETARGQHLLAHELAHTVQQRGLQRSASDLRLGSAEDAHLEQEAERTASTVLSLSAPTSTTPAALQQAVQPILARQGEENATTPPTEVPGGSQASGAAAVGGWVDLADDSPLKQIQVDGVNHSITKQQVYSEQVALLVEQFNLPSEKGPVKGFWQDRATAGALRAVIEFRGNEVARAGLWQRRDRPPALRNTWLDKVGWTMANAAQQWEAAGGQESPAGSFAPKAGSNRCDMDHIIELQIGGTNSRNNIQVLDEGPNSESGNKIWQQVSGLAREARRLWPGTKPSIVILQYKKVEQDPPVAEPNARTAGDKAETCVQMEAWVKAATAATVAARDLGRYPIKSAEMEDTLRVAEGDRDADLSDNENSSAVQLVPGLLLKRLLRPANGNPDTIKAEVDRSNPFGTTRRRTRVPAMVQQSTDPDFRVEADRNLRLLTRGGQPGFDFIYPYLSRGHLNLSHDPQNGLSGTGTLTPSIPFLNQTTMQLDFGQERLRASLTAPPRQAGALLRFTQTNLVVDLAPEFRAAGTLVFEIGPANRALATGTLEASASASGLAFIGSLAVHLPGVDRAEGQLSYRNQQWSGFAVIEASKLHLPGLQNSTLRADFNNDGLVLSGDLNLLLLNQPIRLSALRREGRWLFRGTGTFTLPKLAPINATVETDGENVTASGRAQIQIAGLTGLLTATYNRGRWSGQVGAQFQRGRAQGTVTVRLNESGRISGDGEITYPITSNLVGTVGVTLPEEGPLRVRGTLQLADVELFRRLSERKRLYQFPRISIPIVGLTLGPLGAVGLVARIDSEVGVNYSVGAGVLRNIVLSTAINPLADNPRFEFDAGAQLYIPLYAGFYLSVRGAIALDALVASVSGGVTLTGEAGLRGDFTANAAMRYRENKFALHADATLQGQPELVLGVNADVRAEILSQEYIKRWNLAEYRWGSGLNFGLRLPFDYASDQPPRLPSFNDIQWIYPRELDFTAMLRRLIR